MTFTEAMEAVTKGRCVKRFWWQSEHGSPVIGLRFGKIMKYQFDEWNIYSIDELDIKAEDWDVIPDAPTMDEILAKTNELNEGMLYRKEVESLTIVENLRHMIIQRLAENKRNKDQ